MGRQVGTKLRGNSIYPDSRSQSEVVAVVLILGLVLLGAFVIVGLGVGAIGGTESQLSDDRAEKVLTQLDSKASLVALDRADSQEIAFPSDGSDAFSIDEDAGWLKIEIVNRTTGETSDWADPLMDVSLGALVYENGDTRMAYQGGGVFRTGGERGMMVSPPEFHYRDGTLTLPVVNVTGDQLSGNGARMSHTDENRTFPRVDSKNRTNPLTDHEVVVTVQSEFYEGWGHYFEERTNGEVDYDDDNQTATLVLKTPIGEQVVQDAVGATHTAGDFTLDGDGTQDYITDSYNSTEGSYADSSFGNGTISLNGDFTMESASFEINGSVEVGGLATCQSGNQELVLGSISANQFEDKSDCETNARDGADSDVSIDSENFNVNDFINDTVSNIKDSPTSSNDIEDGEIVFDNNDEATLEPGDYYLEKLEMGGAETLKLKTNGEEINIAVEEYIHFEAGDSTKIDIQGDGRVNMYINGTEKINGDYHFYLEHSGDNEFEIDTPGDAEKSTQSWVYGKDNMKAKLEGSNNHDDTPFVGVLYAPAPENKLGEVSHIEIEGGTVYGGVVAGQVTMNHGSVLFDEALKSKQAIPEETKIVTITYLHVTENTIYIT